MSMRSLTTMIKQRLRKGVAVDQWVLDRPAKDLSEADVLGQCWMIVIVGTS